MEKNARDYASREALNNAWFLALHHEVPYLDATIHSCQYYNRGTKIAPGAGGVSTFDKYLVSFFLRSQKYDTRTVWFIPDFRLLPDQRHIKIVSPDSEYLPTHRSDDVVVKFGSNRVSHRAIVQFVTPNPFACLAVNGQIGSELVSLPCNTTEVT